MKLSSLSQARQQLSISRVHSLHTRFPQNSNGNSDEVCSSFDESSPSQKKKFFRVVRYSLGKTLSKELLIEHELGNDETRHRLIEIHTLTESEKRRHFLLAIAALLVNPPIGLVACILACMAKQRADHMVMTNENSSYQRAVGRYAFVSYILSIISIGLTVSTITAVLLYFFVRDLKVDNRNILNIVHYQNKPALEKNID